MINAIMKLFQVLSDAPGMVLEKVVETKEKVKDVRRN